MVAVALVGPRCEDQSQANDDEKHSENPSGDRQRQNQLNNICDAFRGNDVLLEPQDRHEFARHVLVEVEAGNWCHEKIELESGGNLQWESGFLKIKFMKILQKFVNASYRLERHEKLVFVLVGFHSVNLFVVIRVGLVEMRERHEHWRSEAARRNVEESRRHAVTAAVALVLGIQSSVVDRSVTAAVLESFHAVNVLFLLEVHQHAAAHFRRENRHRLVLCHAGWEELASRTLKPAAVTFEEAGVGLEVPLAEFIDFRDIVDAGICVKVAGQQTRVVSLLN